MTIAEKIQKILLKSNQQHVRCRALMLCPKEYEEFIKEIEPIYKKKYGGLICDEIMLARGYDNVLFEGVAVCLGSDQLASIE